MLNYNGIFIKNYFYNKKKYFKIIISICAVFIIFNGGLINCEYNSKNVYAENHNDTLANSNSIMTDYTNSLPDLFEKVKQSVVQITDPQSSLQNQLGPSKLGSGFVYDNKGHIITNFHVVDGAYKNKVHVTLLDGVAYEAEVIGTDPYADLAVIKIVDDKNNVFSKIMPIQLANSSTLKIGQKVVAVGNPFGLEGSMTEGIISGLGRLMPSNTQELPSPYDNKNSIQNYTGTPSFSIPDIIQTDAAINPGNSGGPLINMNGKVIGINTAIFSNTGAYSGIGFAIPSNFISKIVPSLIKFGNYLHPYVGVNGFDITPDIAKILHLPESSGFLVVNVTKDGPADLSGIKGGNKTVMINGIPIRIGGDVIIRIDNQSVKKVDDILSYLENNKKIGDNVTITLLRGDNLDKKLINVTLQSRPEINLNKNYPSLGVLGFNLTPEISSYLNLTSSNGFLITGIVNGSPAYKSGLKGGYLIATINGKQIPLGGDIIIKLDNIPIKNQKDIKNYLLNKKIGDTIIVTIIRNGELITKNLTLIEFDNNPYNQNGTLYGNLNNNPDGLLLPKDLLDNLLNSCYKMLGKDICNQMIPRK